MFRRDLPRQERYYVTILLLTTDPGGVFLFAQRRKAHDHLQTRTAEEYLFDHLSALRRVVHTNEDTQIQLVVQIRLTDILHKCTVLTQHFRHR